MTPISATRFQLRKNPVARLMDKTFKNKGEFRIEQVTRNLYRSTDVPLNEIANLKDKNFATVFNLRTLNRKELQRLVQEYQKHNIEFINIPLNPFSFKKSSKVIKEAIKMHSQEEKNILVHCTYGCHRTGGFVAMWKHLVEKIPMQDAISDMLQHGYRLRHKIAFSSIIKNLQNFVTNK